MLHTILFLLIIATALFLRTKLRETRLASLSPTQQSLIALGALVFLLLALTGKLGLLIPLMGAVVAAVVALVSRLAPILSPLLARHLPIWLEKLMRDEGVSGKGRTSSTARTLYLEMTLDHASGHMDGRVRQGRHEGQRLSELSLTALVELYRLYDRDDRESAQLLAAFIERSFGNQWNNQAKQTSASEVSLDREEAFRILGLDETATEEEIIAAHRRLMQKVHPDRGGSDYLASRINQAKDHLLRK